MSTEMANPVNWVLVFHLAGMVFWIGGLFVAMAAAGASAFAGPAGAEAGAKAVRARLARQGMSTYAHPGAAIMVLTGALLMYLMPGLRTAGWLHAKLGLVVVLIVFDVALTLEVWRMPDREVPNPRLGIFHGTISLLFLLILILVLTKPF
ncbi:MAG: CopD family protein [Terriglobales bacterium]